MIVLGKSFAGKSTTLKRYGQGKVKMPANDRASFQDHFMTDKSFVRCPRVLRIDLV